MDARERAATLAPLLAQMTDAEREQALRVALRAARRDALEEAAKHLGERVTALEGLRRGARLKGNHTYADMLDAQQMEVRRCAKNIRTLATSGEEGEK